MTVVRILKSTQTVPVPQTNGKTCYALVQETIDAAVAIKKQLEKDGKVFPQFIQLSLDRLNAAQGQMCIALQPQAPVEALSPKQADLNSDRAWGALYDLIQVWLKISMVNGVADPAIQALYDAIFYDGKAFLNIDFVSQWVECDSRLNTLRQEAHTQTLLRIGGESVLETLEKTHSDYGVALGITQQPEVGGQSYNEAYRHLQRQLREYITKSMAWAEPTIPGTTELSEALLTPIETWSSHQTSSTSGSSQSQAPAADAETAESSEAETGSTAETEIHPGEVP